MNKTNRLIVKSRYKDSHFSDCLYKDKIIKNSRIFKVAKALVRNGSHVSTDVSVAKQLVDEVGMNKEESYVLRVI